MELQQSLTQSVPTPAESKREKSSVASLSAAFMVDTAEEQTLPLLWPYMYSTLGATVGQLGSILSFSRLAMTLMFPVWGVASDRYSRKLLLVVFTGFWGLWTLAIGLVDTVNQLTLLRILSGIGLGVFAPAAFSLIGDLFDNESRGKATGIMRTIGVLGILLTVGILPAIAEGNSEGWRTGFFIMGLASFISGLFMLVIKEPVRGASEPELRGVITKEMADQYRFAWADLLKLFRIRSWRYLLVNELLVKSTIVLFTSWNFTLIDTFNLERSTFFLVVLIVLVGIGAGNIFFGWLGDRMERSRPTQGRILVIQIGLIITVPTMAGYLLSEGRGIAWLIIFGLLSSMSNMAASEATVWPVAQAILPPELRGSNRAIINLAVGGVSALLLAWSGSVVDLVGVANALLWFVPFPLLLSAFAWVPMFRSYRQDRSALQKELTRRRQTLLQ